MSPLVFESEKQLEIDCLIEFCESIIKENKVTYISTPISTGKLFNEWKEKNSHLTGVEYKEKHYKEVILQSKITSANARLELLKQNPNKIYVNPTTVFHAEWRQNDYLVFWKEFINIFVEEIVVLDGWQFSNGCVYENFIAHTQKIPIYDFHHNRITVKDSIEIIKKSLKQNKTDIKFIEHYLYNIEILKAFD